MKNNTTKEEVLRHLQEMENEWNSERQGYIEEKKELLRQIRELKKELEIQNNSYELKLETKKQQLDIVKTVVGEKVKKWDTGYKIIEEERNKFFERVKELEGNLALARHDGTQRLEQLKIEKEKLVRELEDEHNNAFNRQKEKLESQKQMELEKNIKDLKALMEKDMQEIIDRQKNLWQSELAVKEEEFMRQRKKWQEEFENQRVDLEKREKEYLEDLLNRFKKT